MIYILLDIIMLTQLQIFNGNNYLFLPEINTNIFSKMLLTT